MSEFIIKNGITINKDFEELLHNEGFKSYGDFMNLKNCEPVKVKKSRSVFKFSLKDSSSEKGERVFYLKRHNYSGSEKFSSLVNLKGREDGYNEWHQTIALREEGFNVMTPVAFGEKKLGPVPLECFTLSEEVSDCVRASDYVEGLADDGQGVKKRVGLLVKLAGLAKDFHDKGFNHQDFYLVHFFLRLETDEIFIMDLQRVHRRQAPSTRWVVKDLGQFVFSALQTGKYTRDDLLVFWHEYFGRDKLTGGEKKMLDSIMSKAARIARHDEKLQKRSGK